MTTDAKKQIETVDDIIETHRKNNIRIQQALDALSDYAENMQDALLTALVTELREAFAVRFVANYLLDTSGEPEEAMASG